MGHALLMQYLPFRQQWETCLLFTSKRFTINELKNPENTSPSIQILLCLKPSWTMVPAWFCSKLTLKPMGWVSAHKFLDLRCCWSPSTRVSVGDATVRLFHNLTSLLDRNLLLCICFQFTNNWFCAVPSSSVVFTLQIYFPRVIISPLSLLLLS